MSLYLDNGLPEIHMIIRTSNTNQITFFTCVDSCAGMNVGNIILHQWSITTNPDSAERCIQFDDDDPFDPIRLNCALGEKKNNLKGNLTLLVTYKKCYKNDNKNL